MKYLKKNRKSRVNEARWISIYAIDQILGKSTTDEDIRGVLPYALDFIRSHRTGEYTRLQRGGEMSQLIERLKKEA